MHASSALDPPTHIALFAAFEATNISSRMPLVSIQEEKGEGEEGRGGAGRRLALECVERANPPGCQRLVPRALLLQRLVRGEGRDVYS